MAFARQAGKQLRDRLTIDAITITGPRTSKHSFRRAFGMEFRADFLSGEEN